MLYLVTFFWLDLVYIAVKGTLCMWKHAEDRLLDLEQSLQASLYAHHTQLPSLV